MKRLKEEKGVSVSDSTLYQWAKYIEKATGTYPFLKAGNEYSMRVIERALANRQSKEK